MEELALLPSSGDTLLALPLRAEGITEEMASSSSALRKLTVVEQASDAFDLERPMLAAEAWLSMLLMPMLDELSGCLFLDFWRFSAAATDRL